MESLPSLIPAFFPSYRSSCSCLEQVFISEYGRNMTRIGRLALGAMLTVAVLAGCSGERTGEMDSVEDTEAHAEGAESDKNALPDTIKTLDYKLGTEVVARGLEEPWAIDFLGPDTALVTEEPGRLRLLIDGELHPDSVAGTPEVSYKGVQGGLLDVAVDPNYEQNGWVYLAYAHGLKTEAKEEPVMIRVVLA